MDSQGVGVSAALHLAPAEPILTARGAAVTLILGPTLVEPPAAAEVVRVTSAQEMHDAALARFPGSDVAIAAAGVATRPSRTTTSRSA